MGSDWKTVATSLNEKNWGLVGRHLRKLALGEARIDLD